MNDKKLLALYGLKWNPFLPNIPVEDLWVPPAIESFLFRVENLVMDGGFALVCGEPGLGKSKNLQMLAHRLERIWDLLSWRHGTSPKQPQRLLSRNGDPVRGRPLSF